MSWALVEQPTAGLPLLRSPTANENWSINPRIELVRLDCATVVVEWAVPEEQLDWALKRVPDRETASGAAASRPRRRAQESGDSRKRILIRRGWNRTLL